MEWRLSLRALLFFCLLWLAACTKQGPAGPAGATGPSGPAGPAGPTGPQGDANVTSVTFDSISVPTNGTYTVDIPAITQAIVDSGVVQAYYKFAYIDDWVPLPYYAYFNNNLVWIIIERIQLGQVVLSNVGVASLPTIYRFDVIAAN